MSNAFRLNAEEWKFVSLIEKATGANPFGDERERIDREITGVDAGAAPDGSLDLVIGRVDEFVRRLEAEKKTDVRRCAEAQRDAFRTTLLFHLYHQVYHDFDAMILAQAGRAEAAEAPFSGRVLDRMRAFGLSQDDALQFLAVFYQLRRAYHFINRGLLGTSLCMRKLRAQLWENVFTHDLHLFERTLWNRMEDFSTLLLGETGTGKGTAASAIGRTGYIPFDRATGRFAVSFEETFTAINLSQFPESLIEAELFGHRKGAFTGAVESHEGHFARCSGNGTVFLDEIGEVSSRVQIKLLRVLQERVFSPVGSHELKRFKGRVVAATNRPVNELRGGGAFRDDFYYRLCSDVVHVPSLRQRLGEDVSELPMLVGNVLDRLCGRRDAKLDAIVLRALDRDVGPKYAWPGNVRELEQAVRRVLLKGGYQPDQLGIGEDATADTARFAKAMEKGELDARGVLERYCRLLYDRHGNYGAVARITGLDRRTVRKYATPS